MKTKKLLSIILTVCLVSMSFSSIVQASAQTIGDVFSQTEDMQTAANPVETNKQFIIKNKFDFSIFMTTSEYWESNYKITLTCDIDMQGETFKPIEEFNGKFDGCGHAINNLKIQDQSNKDKDIELALIKTLSEFAEIKNVTFNNYTIKGNSNTKRAAGLAINNNGDISGVNIKSGNINNINDKTEVAGFVVTNSGKIKKSSTEMSLEKGGLVGGFVSENGSFGIIKECSAKKNASGKISAGGFCGINLGEIIACKSEGNVKAHTGSKKDATICGGFVGTNNGIIKNSNSTGKVEGQEFSGGFVGINGDKGEISLCKSTGNVNSKTYFKFINCGGFVGLDVGKIDNCESKGKTEGKLINENMSLAVSLVLGFVVAAIAFGLLCLPGIVAAGLISPLLFGLVSCSLYLSLESCENAYVGGFCGYNSGEISECDSNNVSFKADSWKNEHNIFGGFVGGNGKDGNIKDCNTTGNKIYNKTSIGGFIGGFVGENSGKIQNGNTTISVADGKCTGGFCGNNAGEIIASNAMGNATIGVNIYETKCGGFVGNNEKGKIDDCASTGKVEGQEYVGGFCGDNSGDISNSHSEGNAKASTLTATMRCGGFAGVNSRNIRNSYALGSGTASARTAGTAKAKAGGFIGENNGGEISNCQSSGGAKATSCTGGTKAGGFIGENNGGEISSCQSSGGAKATSGTGKTEAGGFVGENNGGYINNCDANLSLEKSSEKKVYSKSNTESAKAGGFVGVNNARIENSKATNNVEVYVSSGCFHSDDGCGGFVGKNDKCGKIDKCNAECKVETTNKKKGGGFVGEAKNYSVIQNSNHQSIVILKKGKIKKANFCQSKEKKAVIPK